MTRIDHASRWSGVGLALALYAGFLAAPVQAQGNWVTIKGQVIWPKMLNLPVAKLVNVTTDKEHCLSKGPLSYEDLIIDKETSGVKYVWVYLKPVGGEDFSANEIHPDLTKSTPKTHTIDQPCCQFIPRILAARSGDSLLVKNSSPVPHNINYNADNDAFNVTIPPGGQHAPKAPLAAQRGPVLFKCDIHPWMAGRIMVFDHPYFAVTDDKGNFEIKNAPAGNYRIFYRHENGYHKGRDGAKGFPVEIKAGADGVMTLQPLALELPKPSN